MISRDILVSTSPKRQTVVQSYIFAVCFERSSEDLWFVGQCAPFQGDIFQGHGKIYFKGKRNIKFISIKLSLTLLSLFLFCHGKEMQNFTN